jgi:hypothetical protein
MDQLVIKFAELVCHIANALGIGSMYCLTCQMGMPAYCVDFGYKAIGIISLTFLGFYILDRITSRR